jgi:hypothetical protein
MMAAILFSISLVALGQFGFYYWRAILVANSMAPASERVLVAAGIPATSVRALDFRAILKLYDLAPNLSGQGTSFRMLRTYYWAVEKIGSLVPGLAKWTNSELTICSRYLAALADQHLERNMVCAASLRGL